MRVLYDHQIFYYQRFGGISRYYSELFKAFNKNNEIVPVIPFTYTRNEYLLNNIEEFNFIEPKFLVKHRFPGKGKLQALRNKYFPQYDTSIINTTSVINSLLEKKYDLFHPTYYDDYFMEYINDKPFVITIYDLIYEKYPDNFPPKEVETILRNKKKLIECANHIIAISESVKQDLIEFYKVNENKVSVIYLGNSLIQNSLETNIVRSIEIPDRYILYVGNRLAYKNFIFLIKSIHSILQNNKQLYVVCTGNKFTAAEKKIFRELKIEDRLIHKFVSDYELALLYKSAKIFVFPSLYEGFGIPVLEAMSNGCPMALSNTSSLSEVGGDAAMYFDPTNSESICNTLNICLFDDQVRTELTRKGRERVKLFSWENTAKATAVVYAKVLNTISKNPI